MTTDSWVLHVSYVESQWEQVLGVTHGKQDSPHRLIEAICDHEIFVAEVE